MRKLIAFAAILLAFGFTGCGEKEQKASSVPVPAPGASTPSPAAGTPAPVAEGPKASTTIRAAQPVSSAIGKIDALEGDVRIVDRRGERRARAGMEIEEGDTLKVGANAWALLAMTDGASITMRPDSELKFDNYKYLPDGEAKQNSASLSLVKGAMRSITGYIGQTHRAGYQIKTPTATIGIRGTDHEPAYYPPPAPGEKPEQAPGTYDKVNAGESVIRRPSGEVAVKRGQAAFANNDIKIRPQLLSRPPAFYQQHAQLDRKVAPRREEFHRQFEQQRQKQVQERKQQQDTLKKEQEQQRKDKQRQERQKQQDAQKQKQDVRKAQQEKQREEQKKGRSQPPKDEKKAALPPSVAERVKNQQRGDKASSPAAQQRQQQQQTQQSIQQQLQQRIFPQQQQQQQQGQKQRGQLQQPQPQTQRQLQQQRQPAQQQQQQAQPQRQQQQQGKQSQQQQKKKKLDPPDQPK